MSDKKQTPGELSKLEKSTRMAEEKIQRMFGNICAHSLLGRSINRVKKSKSPLGDLEIISAYVATLPEDEYLIFSGSSLLDSKRLTLSDREGEDLVLMEALEPYRDTLEQDSTYRLILCPGGEVLCQNYQGDYQPLPPYDGGRYFKFMKNSCGVGVAGSGTHSVTLPDIPYILNYGINGAGPVKSPVMVIKRLRKNSSSLEKENAPK